MKFASLLPTAALTALGLVQAGSATAQSSGEVERPSFDVVAAENGVELRRYAPRIVAEVRVTAETSERASNIGFGPLANYIFGANAPGQKIDMTAPVTTAPVRERQSITGGDGEKIAMTAPVTTAPEAEGAYTVRFTMPSEWTMETLPAPQNDSVTLRDLPAQHIVATRFTGPRAPDAIAAAEAAVAAFIDARGLTPAGPFALAGYSGPDVPVSEREWEVHRRVEAPQ
jgi:hypothetical protein